MLKYLFDIGGLFNNGRYRGETKPFQCFQKLLLIYNNLRLLSVVDVRYKGIQFMNCLSTASISVFIQVCPLHLYFHFVGASLSNNFLFNFFLCFTLCCNNDSRGIGERKREEVGGGGKMGLDSRGVIDCLECETSIAIRGEDFLN